MFDPARSRRRVLATGGLLLLLAGALAAVLLSRTSDRPSTLLTTGAATTTAQARTATTRATAPATTRAAAKPQVMTVTLAATNGRCWLEVRRGSAHGPIAYENTLEQGQSTQLRGTRYWVQVGAPSALTVTIDGKPRTLPAGTTFLVAAGGVRAAAPHG